jgi:predicted ATPase
LSTLRKIEADQRRPSVQIAELFAKVFKVPANEQTDFLKFARGEGIPAWGQYNEETPWRVSSPPRSNLPTSTTSLIGREQEIAVICEYLLQAKIRLVTLIGPPGIGKTRLSLETAHEISANFSDGIFFVTLAPLDNPALVAPAIFQVLGYVEDKDYSTQQQIINGIGDKQILLVLDNFEHLMDGAAPLVSSLLSACSRLKVMVTSRESLRVSGEWVYSVPTLNIPKENSTVNMETAHTFPALTLFTERARAVRSDFMLNADNIQTVSSICAQLDGLPLAIELIAARLRLMSPQTLLERLNDQFILSANGMRADSTRQKTLENAIGWSYDLLSPDEQKLFIHLSIFSGGFTLDAVESMYSELFTNKPVRDLIALLLDKSLIRLTVNDLGEIRYDMLVTIRQFALNYLHGIGNESEIHNLHLAYFLNLAKQADKETHGPDQIEWMDRLTLELDNFRAALNWCFSSGQTKIYLQLFNALGWTWNVRWSKSEEQGWFNKIRTLTDAFEYSEDYAQMLNNAGLREWRLGNYREARSILEESLSIWLKLGLDNDLGKAEALNRLGMVARWGESDTDKAESYFNQSLTLFQKEEDDWGVAWNFFHLGGLASDRDQDQIALSFLEQSLSLFNELGDPWGVGRVSQFLGMHYLKLGDYPKTHIYFDEHLNNDERLRFMDGVSVALTNFGKLYSLQGDYVQAEQYYLKSLTISREYGMKADTSVNLYNLGLLALHQNDLQQALLHFFDYFESTRATNEEKAARNFFIGLAAVAGGTNQLERCAKLYGAAQKTENRFSSFNRAIFNRLIQIARDQLGDDLFETLQAQGQSMTLKKAIAFALEIQQG